MILKSGAIRFCISSCQKFAPHTLPVIIPSLLACGIRKQDILVVIGGSSSRRMACIDGIDYLTTVQNSFEYTPLIEVVEHFMVSPFWFLLHDTCIAGPSFNKLVHQPPVGEKVAMKHSPSMSIGLYQGEYLLRHRERLLAIKNLDNSAESLQQWKQWGVPNEDYMLWKLQDTTTHLYHPELHGQDEWNYQGHADLYGTGMPRRIEYFPQLDLKKAKSNWQGVQPHLCIDV